VTERIFGIKSRESVAALSLDKLERGLKILQALEKRVRADKSIIDKGELETLARSTSTSGSLTKRPRKRSCRSDRPRHPHQVP
jgi:hypothetical protein